MHGISAPGPGTAACAGVVCAHDGSSHVEERHTIRALSPWRGYRSLPRPGRSGGPERFMPVSRRRPKTLARSLGTLERSSAERERSRRSARQPSADVSRSTDRGLVFAVQQGSLSLDLRVRQSHHVSPPKKPSTATSNYTREDGTNGIRFKGSPGACARDDVGHRVGLEVAGRSVAAPGQGCSLHRWSLLGREDSPRR